MSATAISWATDSWNPFVGCSLASPACTHCYAMHQAARILRMERGRGATSHYEGVVEQRGNGPVWTGVLNRASEKTRFEPLHWFRPRTVFVGSMSDFFHPSAPDAWRIEALAVAALSPQHTFLILTKRAGDMRRVMNDPTTPDAVLKRANEIAREQKLKSARTELLLAFKWPLANVALGVSTEDQRRADERIPELLATLAAMRFISAEPLLGPIGLRCIRWVSDRGFVDALTGQTQHKETRERYPDRYPDTARLDFVISGGENDLGDRLTHPDWQRSLRDQCAAAGVKFHLKQHGAWAAISELPKDQVSEFFDMEARVAPGASDANCRTRLLDINGHAYRHDQLTAAAEAGAIMMLRVGTRHSGRTLDGRTHDDVLGAAHLSEGALGLKEGA